MKTSYRPRLLSVILLSLLAALLSGCTVELYASLTEQEANEMLAVLSHENIGGRKYRADGAQWTLEVEQSQLSQAMAALRANGLPQERYANLAEVFQRKGLVPSQAEERMRYIHAVSQELAQTLRTMDGVLAARVHIVVAANDPSGDKPKPSSAAVFIKHRPGIDVQLLAPAVKELVAHSIEGLSHEQVLLTWVQAQSLAPMESATAGAKATNAATPVEPQRWSVALVDERAVVVLTMLLAGAVGLLVLPNLLRRLRR